jgi:histidinol-phosphate aminotransferase
VSPTPVTFASPTKPSSYAWEATSEAVAGRYGLPLEAVVRFDLNTSPAAPELAERFLREGRFGLPLSEYPPSDYAALVAAAARRYDAAPEEILVGAGADEILDLCAKAFLPPGGSAVVPAPTYAMFAVLTTQRPARVITVPRHSAADGFTLDLGPMRDAAREADLVWIANPNNPTGLAEPERAIQQLLADLAADSVLAGRPAPTIVLDEAYSDFAGRSLAGLRHDHPRLVIVKTLSKAYAAAGLRVGFAIARPELIAELAVYRPPGSVSVPSVAIATALLGDDAIARTTVARVTAERARLATALQEAGWTVLPSTTNFLLVDFDDAAGAGDVAEALLRRGLVPRTFPGGHPLAAYLRLTVRNEEQDDRLIAAAREIGS